jgi:hypothetical protein
MNLVDFVRERAKEFGNKVFLREKKNSLTYREFDRVTDRFAAGLQALGVKKGDHAAAPLHGQDLAPGTQKRDQRMTFLIYPLDSSGVFLFHSPLRPGKE